MKKKVLSKEDIREAFGPISGNSPLADRVINNLFEDSVEMKVLNAVERFYGKRLKCRELLKQAIKNALEIK